MNKYFLSVLLLFVLVSGCTDYYSTKNNPITYGDDYLNINLSTDKVSYQPDGAVRFSLKTLPSGNFKVRYSYLGTVLKEENLISKTWTWTVPGDDYKGYMIDVYAKTNGKDSIYSSIAVDVSSDWKKFPRYGFLSYYGNLSTSQINAVINNLNRYHINGLQFYDWEHDHQRPLAGSVLNPSSSWLDLIGRTNYLSTVKAYINAAKDKNMKTMFYNLAYGALDDAAADGVKDEWYLYNDVNHVTKNQYVLSSPFRSNIYITNPANTDWQNYLAGRNSDVYKVFGFDGYHIDQLGDRGTVYDYKGNKADPASAFGEFIAAMKKAQPDKSLVMNAVAQYGQNSIAGSSTDFLYTEVWDPCKTFEQLAQMIIDNNSMSNNTKSTVLAAYMDYNNSKSSGYVNEAGVLMTNAVIFAFGGDHLELGEHYLANEYFPNNNLLMSQSLKGSLMNDYDFLVGYENLLRDGGIFYFPTISSDDAKMVIGSWPAGIGEVAVIGKSFATADVIHLVNFTNAVSMDWRDTNGTQTVPVTIQNASISIPVKGTPKKVWLASPDISGGIAQSLHFVQNGNRVSVVLPSLKYWDMIGIDY